MGELFVQIGSEEFAVTLRVEATYSPDILDDLTNRALRAYKEASADEAEPIATA